MKNKYGLIRRPWGVYYSKDKTTGKQESLGTKNKQEALRVLHSMNEAFLNPMVSLQIARAYLCAADPKAKSRTWQDVMDDITLDKKDKTLYRWKNAIKDKALNPLRKLPLVETRADDLKAVLRNGTVSTNVYLRRLHNHALNMRWLLEPVLVKKVWPKVEFKEKRAITHAEHLRIIAREMNPERKLFYELLWLVGGSQSDMALLRAENIDWRQRVIGCTQRAQALCDRRRSGRRFRSALACEGHQGLRGVLEEKASAPHQRARAGTEQRWLR